MAASPLLRGGSDTYSDTLPVPQQGGQAPQSVGITLAIPELPKNTGEVCAAAEPVGELSAQTCPAKPVGKPDSLANTHHTHAAARPHDPGWVIASPACTHVASVSPVPSGLPKYLTHGVWHRHMHYILNKIGPLPNYPKRGTIGG